MPNTNLGRRQKIPLTAVHRRSATTTTTTTTTSRTISSRPDSTTTGRPEVRTANKCCALLHLLLWMLVPLILLLHWLSFPFCFNNNKTSFICVVTGASAKDSRGYVNDDCKKSNKNKKNVNNALAADHVSSAVFHQEDAATPVAILALPTGVLFATHITFNTATNNTNTTTNNNNTSSSSIGINKNTNTANTTMTNKNNNHTDSSSSVSYSPLSPFSSSYTISNDGHFLYGPFGRRAFPTTTATVVEVVGTGVGSPTTTTTTSEYKNSVNTKFIFNNNNTSNNNDNNNVSSSSYAAASNTPRNSANTPPTGPLLAPSCADVTSLRYYTPTTTFMFPVPPSQRQPQPQQPSSSADVGGPQAVINGTCQTTSGTTTATAGASSHTTSDINSGQNNNNNNTSPVTAMAPVVVSLLQQQQNSPHQPLLTSLPDALVGPVNEILTNIEGSLGEAALIERCTLLSRQPRGWWSVRDLSALRAGVPAPPAPPAPPHPSVEESNNKQRAGGQEESGGSIYRWTLVAAYAQATTRDTTNNSNSSNNSTRSDSFSLSVETFGYTCVANTTATTTAAATPPSDGCGERAVAVPVYRLSSLVLAYAFVATAAAETNEIDNNNPDGGAVIILAATVFFGGMPYAPRTTTASPSTSSYSASSPPPVRPVSFNGIVSGGMTDNYGSALSYGYLGNVFVRSPLPSAAYTATQLNAGGGNMLNFIYSSSLNESTKSNGGENNSGNALHQQQCSLVTPPRMADGIVPRWSHTIEGGQYVSYSASCIDYINAGGYVGLTNVPFPSRDSVTLHESDYLLLSVTPPPSSSSSSSSSPLSATWLFPADVVLSALFDGLGGTTFFGSGDGGSDNNASTTMANSIIPPFHAGVYKHGLFASFNIESVTTSANTIFSPYTQTLASVPQTGSDIESDQQWVQPSDDLIINFPPTCPWLAQTQDYNAERDLCLGPILGIRISSASSGSVGDSQGGGGGAAGGGGMSSSSSASNCLGADTMRSVAISFNPSLTRDGDEGGSSSTHSMGPLLTTMPTGECVLFGQLLASVPYRQGGFSTPDCPVMVAPPLPRDSLGYASASLRQNLNTLGQAVGPSLMASCQNLPTSNPVNNSNTSSSPCPRWPSPYPIVGDTLPLDYQGPPPADQTAFLTNEEAWCAFNQYLAGTPTAPTMGVTLLCSADRKTVYVVTCGDDHFPSLFVVPPDGSSLFAGVDFDAPTQGPPMMGTTWAALWSYWLSFTSTPVPPTLSSSSQRGEPSGNSKPFQPNILPAKDFRGHLSGQPSQEKNKQQNRTIPPPYYAGLGGVPLMAFDAVNDPSGFQFHCSACTPFIEAGIGPLPYAAVAIAALKEALLVAIGVYIMSFPRLQHAMAAAAAWLSSLVVPFSDSALSRRLQHTVAETLRTCDDVTPAELVQSARSFFVFAVTAAPQATPSRQSKTELRRRREKKNTAAKTPASIVIEEEKEDAPQQARENDNTVETTEGGSQDARNGAAVLFSVREDQQSPQPSSLASSATDGDSALDSSSLFAQRSFEAFFLYFVLRRCQKKIHMAELVQWLGVEPEVEEEENIGERCSRAQVDTSTAPSHRHTTTTHVKNTHRAASDRISFTIDRRWERDDDDDHCGDDYLSVVRCREPPGHRPRHQRPPPSSLLPEEEEEQDEVELLSQAIRTHEVTAKRLAALEIAHRLCALRTAWERFLRRQPPWQEATTATTAATARQSGCRHLREEEKRDDGKEEGEIKDDACIVNHRHLADKNILSPSHRHPCDTPLLPSQEDSDKKAASKVVAVTAAVTMKPSGDDEASHAHFAIEERCRATLCGTTRALWEALESHGLLVPVAFSDTSIDHRITPPAWLLLMHLLFCFVYMIVILASVVRAHDLRCENLASIAFVTSTTHFHCVLSNGWVVYQAIFFRYMNSTASMSLIVNAIIRVLYQPLPPPELGRGGNGGHDGGNDVGDDAHFHPTTRKNNSCNADRILLQKNMKEFFGPSDWDLVRRAGHAAMMNQGVKGVYNDSGEFDKIEDGGFEDGGAKGDDDDAAMVAVLRRGDCIDTITTLRSIARRCARDRFFQCGVLLPLPVLLTHALVGAVLYAWVTIPVIGLLVLVAVTLDRAAMPPLPNTIRKGNSTDNNNNNAQRPHSDNNGNNNINKNNQNTKKNNHEAHAPRTMVLRVVTARLAVRVLITFTCVLLCQTTVNWMVLAYTGGGGNARLAYTFSRDTDTFYRQAQEVGRTRVPNTFLFRHRFPPPPPLLPSPINPHFNGTATPTLLATAGTAAAVERLQDAQYVSYFGVLAREYQSRRFACTLEMLAATLGGAMQSVSVLF